MRPIKKLVIYAFFILLIAGSSWAQDITCDDITYSSVDSIKIDFFEGRPDSTVLMPFRVVNDSIVTVFQFLFKFDTTWLTPIVQLDSTCEDYDVVRDSCLSYSYDTYIEYEIPKWSRIYKYAVVEVGGIPDTVVVTKFKAKFAQDIGDPLGGKLKDVIACNFLPVGDRYDSLPGGNDVIFYIKFKVKETMPDGQLSYFSFYEHDLFVIDSSDFPPDTSFVGCYSSQMSANWYNTSTGETDNYQIFPTPKLTPMVFRCNFNYEPEDDPVVNTFAAFPSTVTATNQQVQLSWAAENADSVVITQASNRVTASTNLNSTYNVTLPGYSDGSTYTYTATAYGAGKTASRLTNVTVDIGGVSNNSPSISFNPTQTTYEINQGETVSFTVSANDIDNDQVTLTATNLPNNASFGPSNPVIGAGNVTGNFSFTPDFNQNDAVVISFTASDGIATANAVVTIIIKKIEEDRLFSTSAPGQSPVGGLRGA